MPRREPGARAGRNLPLAILTGLLLAGVLIGSLVLSRPAFIVFLLGIVTLALLELLTVLRARATRPARPVVLAVGALLVVGAYLEGPAALSFGLLVTILAAFAWYLVDRGRTEVTRNVAATVFACVYVPFMAAHLSLVVGRGHPGPAADRPPGLAEQVLGGGDRGLDRVPAGRGLPAAPVGALDAGLRPGPGRGHLRGGAARRPLGVDAQARPRREGHGVDPARPRRRARPGRRPAVHGPGPLLRAGRLRPDPVAVTRSLYDLDPGQLEALVAEAGEPPYRARQLAHWLDRRRQPDPGAMTNLPRSLRARLSERFAEAGLALDRHQVGDDGWTHKFLFRLPGGDAVESVLMFYPPAGAGPDDDWEGGRQGRATVCISTQA